MAMNRTPLGVVDRTGTVWPWDGRDENDKIIEVGSRYIYDPKEFKLLMEASGKANEERANTRKKKAANPAKKPKEPEPLGEAKEVKKAVLDL